MCTEFEKYFLWLDLYDATQGRMKSIKDPERLPNFGAPHIVHLLWYWNDSKSYNLKIWSVYQLYGWTICPTENINDNKT